MLIRSQDKEILINFDLIKYIYFLALYKKGYTICANDDLNVIGVYSTKKKTIKVLDMIQEAYEKYEYEKVFKTGLVSLETFQMPDDSEVEG